jgi:hypothetical protein
VGDSSKVSKDESGTIGDGEAGGTGSSGYDSEGRLEDIPMSREDAYARGFKVWQKGDQFFLYNPMLKKSDLANFPYWQRFAYAPFEPTLGDQVWEGAQGRLQEIGIGLIHPFTSPGAYVESLAGPLTLGAYPTAQAAVHADDIAHQVEYRVSTPQGMGANIVDLGIFAITKGIGKYAAAGAETEAATVRPQSGGSIVAGSSIGSAEAGEIALRNSNVGGTGSSKKPFAMGLQDEGLDAFAEARGATTWKDFPSPENWQSGVLEKLADPETPVHFNLDGVNVWQGVQRAASGIGGPTDWELLQIRQNQQFWHNLHFWLDGKPVPNPFK